MNSTEISMLRVFRRLLDKLKETNGDEYPRALGAVHVVIRVWESRPPRRQTSVAAVGWRRVALTASCRGCLPSVLRARRVRPRLAERTTSENKEDFLNHV